MLQQMRSLRSTFLFSCSSSNLNDDEDIYFVCLYALQSFTCLSFFGKKGKKKRRCIYFLQHSIIYPRLNLQNWLLWLVGWLVNRLFHHVLQVRKCTTNFFFFPYQVPLCVRFSYLLPKPIFAFSFLTTCCYL